MPRIIGGRDRAPIRRRTRAPLWQMVPYSRAWWRALAGMMRDEFRGTIPPRERG